MLDQLVLGQQVTVTVKHALAHVRDRYAFHIPDTVVYTGTLTREPWFESDEIGITSDVAWFPVRRIRINRIVRIGDSAVQLQPEPSEVITVTGSKGNTYTVTRESGRTSCTCPGYAFRKTCKHLSEM
jgi:hypothetical protein